MLLKNEEKAIFALRSLYAQYGYCPYKMSRFEEYDLYVRNKDFLISDRIITFSDGNGRLLALKPDVTLSIVKNAPEAHGQVQKVYYNENVYRDFREIMQTGLECVGDVTEYDVAEVVLLAAKSLELLGKPYVLDVSHMGLMAAVLEQCDLTAAQKAQAMDCLRSKNLGGLKAVCPAGAYEKLEKLALCRGGMEELEELQALATDEKSAAALQQLRGILQVLSDAGYGHQVRLDFSVSNNMGYYSGVVFKGYVQGVPTGVLSGGQYDKLLQKMSRKSSAVGFAIYVDLLQEENADFFDVDTLILHDGTIDPKTLMTQVERAKAQGSVLVATVEPRGRRWKNLIRLGKEETAQ